QVGQLERDDEGVGDRPRAEQRRQHDIAREAVDARQQREAADREDRRAEAHGSALPPLRVRTFAPARKCSIREGEVSASYADGGVIGRSPWLMTPPPAKTRAPPLRGFREGEEWLSP